MYKIDLHTHSTASHDGGLRIEHYRRLLDTDQLHTIAITDHNNIHEAVRIKEALGERIIVGEEIMTTAGEIIGLYLTRPIHAGLPLKQTVEEIQHQGGLVYIPHPFETFRKGLNDHALLEIATDVDIIEVINGRAFAQKRGSKTMVWARIHEVAVAASSDAHGPFGIGKTYTTVKEVPSRNNLVSLLSSATVYTQFVGVRGLLHPKTNRLRKLVRRRS